MGKEGQIKYPEVNYNCTGKINVLCCFPVKTELKKKKEIYFSKGVISLHILNVFQFIAYHELHVGFTTFSLLLKSCKRC